MIISLVEQPSLTWAGRINYLLAKHEERQVDLYAMDLLWSLARSHLANDVPMPSEIWNNKVKNDRRSGKQIVDDLLKKLGGE